MNIFQALANDIKHGDPALLEGSLEAAVTQLVQGQVAIALASLKDRETQALDSLKALAKELFAELLAAGETHRVRNEVSFEQGKTVVMTTWEKK